MEQFRSYSSELIDVFKNRIPTFIRPSPSRVFNCYNYEGIRTITQLHVGLSHLRGHKFKHSFQNCLNQICSCGLNIESILDLLLDCPIYNNKKDASS